MPLVPLCHLKEHLVVHPRRKGIEQLALLFELDAYLKEKAKFICSLQSLEQNIQEIQKGDMLAWGKLQRKQHAGFEAKIRGTEREVLSNKYLYTWDGNHRLASWTKVIKQGNKFLQTCIQHFVFMLALSKKLRSMLFAAFTGNFKNDLDRHPCVKVTLVHADLENQVGLMHVVARLNK